MIKINTIEEFNGVLKTPCCEEISGFDFFSLDLKGIYLGYRDFKFCRFNLVDFNYSILGHSSFIHCDFNYSNFEKANLLETKFIESSFFNCDFLDVESLGTEFNKCYFNKVKFYKKDEWRFNFIDCGNVEEYFINSDPTYLEKIVNITKAEQKIYYTKTLPFGFNSVFKEIKSQYTLLNGEYYYSDNLFPGQWGNYLIHFKIDSDNRKIINSMIKHEEV